MKPTSSPQDHDKDQEIIEILKRWGSIEAIYPPELHAARRAAFLAQADQLNRNQITEERNSQDLLMKCLEDLSSFKAEYPSELLIARRANFIEQIEQRSGVEVKEELSSRDQELIRLLKNVKSFEPEYSPRAFAARRAAYIQQIAHWGGISLLEALRSFIQSRFLDKLTIPTMPTMSAMRTTVVVAILVLAAFVGSRLENRGQVLSPLPSQTELVQPDPILVATNTGVVAEVVCKPGYAPPLCLAQEFDNSKDLTFQGNGSARAAVAKDTIPGYDGIHDAAYVNDGLYGPGSSWVSNSPNSWIKIDLGRNTTINTVTFGRDRLGNFNDRHPGKFVIAVALADNLYADGNSSNDYMEYTEVYNSDQAGFNGVVSGSETIWASFSPVRARYVKITFENAGTAVDEIEVYMVRPPAVTVPPTKKPKDDQPGVASTSIPANTPVPTSSAIPKSTSTPVPTDPPPPTNTAIPPPTDPPPTNPPPTDPPPPTDSPPTDAQLPPPPDTVEPIVELFETPVPAGEP